MENNVLYVEKIKVDNSVSAMSEFLAHALWNNTNDLLKLIARFDSETFNKIPSTGGWSAGQIAEHLLLFDSHVMGVFTGETGDLFRDYQLMVNVISEIMKDLTTKLIATQDLLPSETAKSPDALAKKLMEHRRKLLDSSLQPSVFYGYRLSPHRLFCQLSGIEWITFVIYHSRRHMIQMENCLNINIQSGPKQ